MALSKNTTTIIAILILIAGVVAYFMFFNKPPEATVSASDAPSTTAESTFLNLSSQIDPVTFDTSLFDDPRFKALTDIRIVVIPEPSGRRDPFAAI